MKKQKTLIFSLLAFFLIAISFVVYSAPWAEPTTMPSSYNPPINTSSIAQTKTGEIGASVFRDADNSSYYINPSGNSIISGKITTKAEIRDTDSSETFVNKEYVDLLLGQTLTEDMPAAKLYVVQALPSNSLLSCPNGTLPIARHWSPKECSFCITPEWGGPINPPSCKTFNAWMGAPANCLADTNDMVICAGPDPANMLFGLEHSLNDCANAGGTVETVEDNIKICKIGYQKLAGNCSSNNVYFGTCGEERYSTADSCVCPEGWKLYKNWSQTEVAYSPCSYIRLTSQGSWESANPHTWSDLRRELCSYGDGPDCTVYMPYVTYKGCY